MGPDGAHGQGHRVAGQGASAEQLVSIRSEKSEGEKGQFLCRDSISFANTVPVGCSRLHVEVGNLHGGGDEEHAEQGPRGRNDTHLSSKIAQ